MFAQHQRTATLLMRGQMSGKFNVVSSRSLSTSFLSTSVPRKSAGTRQFLSRRNNSTITDIAAVNNSVTTIISPATTNTIAETAHAIGDLKLAGLASSYTPVGLIQQGLETLHVTTGLPWWACIAAVTIGIRTALFPLIVKLQKDVAVLQNIKPELDDITASMQKAKVSGDSVGLQNSARAAQELFQRNNTHPLKALMMPMVQAPVMISFFISLRSMAEANIPSFKHGGFAWFTDLSLADPTYALPIIAAAGFLIVLEIGAETGTTAASAAQRNLFRGMGVLMVPFTASLPAAVFMYWITSNVFTIGQALLLKQPEVRKILGIPQLVKHQKEITRLTGAPEKLGFIEGFKAAYSAERATAINAKKAIVSIGGTAPSSRDVVKASLAKK